jgi:hypothetical protein
MNAQLPLGTLVKVTPSRYDRDDRFSVGRWYVVGILPEGPCGGGRYWAGLDYKLARHPQDDWEVLIHHSRVTPVSPEEA